MATALSLAVLTISLAFAITVDAKQCSSDSDCSSGQCCMFLDRGRRDGKCTGLRRVGELCMSVPDHCPRCGPALKCQQFIPQPPVGKCVNA